MKLSEKQLQSDEYQLSRIHPKLGLLKSTTYKKEKCYFPQFNSNGDLIKLTLRYFSEIPEELGKFTNLRSLKLYHYNNSFLPSWIENFKNLEELSISDSNIEYLPIEFYSLTKLQDIHISSTPLKKLDEAIENLKELNYLVV